MLRSWSVVSLGLIVVAGACGGVQDTHDGTAGEGGSGGSGGDTAGEGGAGGAISGSGGEGGGFDGGVVGVEWDFDDVAQLAVHLDGDFEGVLH